MLGEFIAFCFGTLVGVVFRDYIIEIFKRIIGYFGLEK